MGKTASPLSVDVPDALLHICQVLQGAGYQAFTVGGAIRDAILGRVPSDWDVATSATPDEVSALFEKTLPTGIEHGTVTVLVGKGSERVAIEVTTFRGEGEYTDARRPDHVVFGVPLKEDLARRDFVMNAVAYDPVTNTVEDPFGGVEDIGAGHIRAVGRAIDRFSEDGLRIMRAVRFCAQLEFDVVPETKDAIEPALPSLAKVSHERILVELVKLLSSPKPEAALRIGLETGIWRLVIPEVSDDTWRSQMSVVTACPAIAEVRIAAICHGLEAGITRSVMRRLTASNAMTDSVCALVSCSQPDDLPGTEVEVRTFLARAGRKHAANLISLWTAMGRKKQATLGQATLDNGVPLSTGELAIGGKELMAHFGKDPGPWLGQCLGVLLDSVLKDPGNNTPEKLLALAGENT